MKSLLLGLCFAFVACTPDEIDSASRAIDTGITDYQRIRYGPPAVVPVAPLPVYPAR